MNKSILFFDSGVGGLPYLENLRNKFVNENFIYVADNKNFPYGEKTESELKNIILNSILMLIEKFDPKVICIACNTASVTALKDVREHVTIPIVGVVPAIKTASSLTTSKRIGILATKRTVKGIYLQNLITEFSGDKKVFPVGASDIVNYVENHLNFQTAKEIKEYIDKSVQELKEYNIDSVVLGCTHFIHVATEIQEALGHNVLVIDSREGVSNQVARVAKLKNKSKTSGVGLFYITKKIDNETNYKKFCDKYSLIFKGEIIS